MRGGRGGSGIWEGAGEGVAYERGQGREWHMGGGRGGSGIWEGAGEGVAYGRGEGRE